MACLLLFFAGLSFGTAWIARRRSRQTSRPPRERSANRLAWRLRLAFSIICAVAVVGLLLTAAVEWIAGLT